MRLLMISHKETWLNSDAPGGYVTVGGFPFQVRAITRLFDSMRLIVTLRASAVPRDAQPLAAPNLSVVALTEPTGSNLRRKIALLVWLPRHLPTLWREIARADAVHAPVPGDIGFIGLLLALFQRKPLFVRHCGTWGEPATVSDRILLWLLEKFAGGRNVVLATGGTDEPPSPKNPNIHWIFSTTLNHAELDQLPPATPWDGRSPLRLVTVGRVTNRKNMAAILEALPAIHAVYPETTLDILGEGEARAFLESRSSVLGLRSSVSFHGNVSHQRVLEILLQSHLFVFPTRTKEGFPKAVLEALACSLPVVATRVSVIPRLLNNGCGVLLDDTSAQAVTAAVLQVAASPQRMAEMGSLARRAAQGYTLEAWGQEIGAHLAKAWGGIIKGQPGA